jgi:hypothetical protein
MRKIYHSTKRNQIKFEKSKFGKFNHKNDVIHDAHIGHFGDIGTGSILTKNVKLRRFSAIILQTIIPGSNFVR